MKRRKTVNEYDKNYLATKKSIKELNPKSALISLFGLGLVAGTMGKLH